MCDGLNGRSRASISDKLFTATYAAGASSRYGCIFFSTSSDACQSSDSDSFLFVYSHILFISLCVNALWCWSLQVFVKYKKNICIATLVQKNASGLTTLHIIQWHQRDRHRGAAAAQIGVTVFLSIQTVLHKGFRGRHTISPVRQHGHAVWATRRDAVRHGRAYVAGGRRCLLCLKASGNAAKCRIGFKIPHKMTVKLLCERGRFARRCMVQGGL